MKWRTPLLDWDAQGAKFRIQVVACSWNVKKETSFCCGNMLSRNAKDGSVIGRYKSNNRPLATNQGISNVWACLKCRAAWILMRLWDVELLVISSSARRNRFRFVSIPVLRLFGQIFCVCRWIMVESSLILHIFRFSVRKWSELCLPMRRQSWMIFWRTVESVDNSHIDRSDLWERNYHTNENIY